MCVGENVTVFGSRRQYRLAVTPDWLLTGGGFGVPCALLENDSNGWLQLSFVGGIPLSQDAVPEVRYFWHDCTNLSGERRVYRRALGSTHSSKFTWQCVLQEKSFRTINRDAIVQCPHPDCQYYCVLGPEDAAAGTSTGALHRTAVRDGNMTHGALALGATVFLHRGRY